VLAKRGGFGPIFDGHWITVDIPVPVVLLSNGAASSILILMQNAAHPGPGTYRLQAVLDRDRWSASTEADPEQHHRDEQNLDANLVIGRRTRQVRTDAAGSPRARIIGNA
jgi:hypothetical protein